MTNITSSSDCTLRHVVNDLESSESDKFSISKPSINCCKINNLFDSLLEPEIAIEVFSFV